MRAQAKAFSSPAFLQKGEGRGERVFRGVLLAAFLLLAACAPRVEGLGPETGAPRLADGAIVAADGYRLPLRRWGPEERPRAVILGLHGFNDYSGFLENAAEIWAERGILTVAYDQRGFGETEGRGLWHGAEALVSDARAAVRLVRARWPEAPLTLMGESMGGAVAIAALSPGYPGGGAAPSVDGLVLSAPAAADWERFSWWRRALFWTAAHTVPWMEATGRGLKLKPSDNIEMLRALGRDPLVIKRTRLDAVWGLIRLGDAAYDAADRLPGPALVLWGAKEALIPPESRDALNARLPEAGVERRLYPAGHHMLTRDLAGEIVVGDIAAWAAAR
ncbi:MAG: alpha/beta hydrolase [Marivibrio sp.]|uniref:alpha/beta hydrolase n=1 Tax=Marivibrio sp. TaxID=2039719 RepID=UPI0032EE11FF